MVLMFKRLANLPDLLLPGIFTEDFSLFSAG